MVSYIITTISKSLKPEDLSKLPCDKLVYIVNSPYTTK